MYRYWVGCLIGVLCWAGFSVGGRFVAAAETRGSADLPAGLVVQVGAGDIESVIRLAAEGGRLIQVFDTDAKKVATARELVAEAGLYGTVAVDRFDGQHLPIIDDVAAAVILRSSFSVRSDEALRVARPLGVVVHDNGTITVKPRPASLDVWTHYLHDPTNNAVSKDSVVAPPRRYQWVGSPRYSRHHDRMSSVSAVVATEERVFSIVDEALPVSILLPPRWQLVARDAFSGVVLWKKPIDKWAPHLWPLKNGPANLPRRLVAQGDRVFVTLSFDGPVSMLDAATGKTVRTYADTEGAEEILLRDGVLYLVIVRDRPTLTSLAPAARNQFYWQDTPRRIMAVDSESGNVLWAVDSPVLPVTLTVGDARVLFHDGKSVVCLNRDTGEVVWRSQPIERAEVIQSFYAPTLVLYDNVVLFSGGETAGVQTGSWYMSGKDTMTALSLEDGRVLWQAPHPPSGYRSAEDLFVAKGLVWTGETTSGRAVGVFTGRDPLSGEIKVAFPPDVDTYWFHHRCYRGKATENYLLTSRTGTEFIDIEKHSWDINDWVRGACLYGVMPANGMLYAPQHPCACYLESKLSGFNAVAPAKGERVPGWARNVPRLEKGEAYDWTPAGDVRAEWPTYRHDGERSGRTSAKVGIDGGIDVAWEAKLGTGKLTPPVVGNGLVYVAAVDRHVLYAVDQQSGEVRWQYTTGGRIDSPPTLYRGRVLFGCRDGYVYCLRADDGALIWRFRAAPVDQRMVAWEQVESVWPVHGSVLIHNDRLYTVAGRSLFLDDGMRFLILDPESGELIAEKQYDARDPATGKEVQEFVSWLNMPAAMPDIMSTDGKLLYMLSAAFDFEGNRLPLEKMPTSGNADAGAPEPFVRPDRVHLFSPTGFTDDTWWHRTYWIYGSDFISGWQGYFRAGMAVPAGRILVLGDDQVFGYGRKPKYYRWTTPIEHQLFAAPKPGLEKAEQPSGKTVLEIAPSEALSPANTALTVEAWIRPSRETGVVLAHGGGNLGYVLYLDKGRPVFQLRWGPQATVKVAGKRLDLKQWHHVAGVVTAEGNVRLFVDGAPSGRAEAPQLLAKAPMEGISIGRDDRSLVGDYTGASPFDGVIDEVRIYHEALSPADVASHASGDSAAPIDSAVLALSFDDGKVQDASPAKNACDAADPQFAEGKFGEALVFSGGEEAVPGYRVPHEWIADLPFFARAMVLTGDALYVAGPVDLINEEELYKEVSDPSRPVPATLREQEAAFEGRKASYLGAVSPQTGELLGQWELPATPTFDGMIATDGCLWLSTQQGTLLCIKPKR
ncbi:hypothetical protein JCM19992_15880 [Thermostilla marina]